MIIDNKQEYDEKVPTNIRLEKDLKEKAFDLAAEKHTTLSDVINRALKSYVNIKNKGE